MIHRREAVKRSARLATLLVTAGLLARPAQAWNQGAFSSKSLPETIKAIGVSSAPIESREVVVTGPDIAENGAVVPLGVSSNLPGIKQLLVLIEKNPNPLVAVFNVSEAVEANFLTRAKMSQSSDVYAVAITQDGRALFSRKEIKVTLGGCGG